jgi:hypothetical protein
MKVKRICTCVYACLYTYTYAHIHIVEKSFKIYYTGNRYRLNYTKIEKFKEMKMK